MSQAVVAEGVNVLFLLAIPTLVNFFVSPAVVFQARHCFPLSNFLMDVVHVPKEHF